MIRLDHVTKVYHGDAGDVEACRDVSLHIKKGEVFGIIGFSGAGKSTLIRCINLLEKPTSGTVTVDGVELTALMADRVALTEEEKKGGFRRWRLRKKRAAGAKALRDARRNIGMIFQQFNLLMQKTALDNICFPLITAGVPKAQARARATQLLELVGLPDKALAYPAQLSGGQKQRVAIARALATDPKVLLCDEATSALDPTTTRSILALLKDINKKLGITIVIITHEMKVIEEICHRVAIMDDSRIAEMGSVAEVFTNPRSAIGKKLIFPDDKNTEPFKLGKSIRVIFDGGESFEPVIANMILECACPVNILYADTKSIDGRDYGQMVLGLPDNEAVCDRMKAYLTSKKIRFEEAFLNE